MSGATGHGRHGMNWRAAGTSVTQTGSTMPNPFKVVRVRNFGASLTGHDYAVKDTRTGEQIGDGNMTRRFALEIARKEWAEENGG